MIIEGAPLFAAFILALIFLALNRRNGNSRPLPPGPKKLPLLGNLRDMPSSFQWIAFSQWAKQYDSDILHLEVAGSQYIVLNSYDAAADLLDKRSSIYSSRPHATMLYDLVGYVSPQQAIECSRINPNIVGTGILLLMSYGEDLKAHRKLFQQEFHPNHPSLHRPHEKKALVVFLNGLLETPEEWMGHIRHMTGSIILRVAYGIHVQPNNDPDIHAAEKMISVLNIAGLPGAFLVDTLPILKYVPSWFPGASFKRKAKAWNGILAATITPPFMKVKKAMKTASAYDVYKMRNIQIHVSIFFQEEEEIIKETAGTMYEGGADTGITALRTFILAILNFPNAQREAQEELDRVIGKERLPDYDDKDSLPYITAVTYECGSPLYPFPHRVDTEDTYRGYLIPKDSVVIPNVWGILRDPSIYGPNAHEFEPKRWLIKTNGGEWKLNPDMRDPTTISFGFGRRVCPGKHMGLSSLWINIASLLHSFNITPAIAKDGKPIEPRVKYVSGVLSAPAPFECTIRPRSDGHVALVKEALASELEG
ncbi:cytochrome P450 [Gymnopus androsaceus JB14]|uniref:Cytochrome P450 n=1 Tax=Gymnopus androsaceus JB14 TaxID=1447944 RepID=A0A6A4HKR4_9AGAR|nr:cytochrome P450 [Gymnopus androsaceus JB14]